MMELYQVVSVIIQKNIQCSQSRKLIYLIFGLSYVQTNLDIIDVLRNTIIIMRSSKHLLIMFSVWIVIFNIACGEIQKPEIVNDAIDKVTLQPLDQKEIEILEYVDADNQATAQDSPIISIENVANLVLRKRIYPFFPEITQISFDGSTTAIGDLSGVKIIDLATDEVLTQIDAPVQTCHYGFRKLFQFNKDGTFLAIALKDRIQVWQVGGGVIYEALYKNNHVLDPLTCGADIPQLALSPDGKLLVESGFQISTNGVQSYFIVTDIIKNIVVYEWEGKNELPHGQLYTFPGLGFSANGSILQTFDPTRYGVGDNDYQHPFRFWSMSNWQEIDPDSKEIINGFSKGDLLFGRSAFDSFVVFDKITGIKLKAIEAAGCDRDYPCQVKFSSDGSKVAVLEGVQKEPYMRESINTMVSIYEISNGKKLSDYPISSRDLDGILINNDGEIIQYQKSLSNRRPQWWTQMGYFSGFRAIDEKFIAFTPQIVLNGGKPQEPYSSSCQIQLDGYSINCFDSLIFMDGYSAVIEKKNGGISVLDTTDENNKLLAEIKDPQGEVGDLWQYRLMNYAGETGIGFLCVDRNLREESCFIMDFPNNEILYDRIDLEGIQYSQISRTAAYVDKNKKALFVFSDDNDSLKQMRTYQANSLPIKPVYLSNGNELIYVVQSLENQKNIYIERIDAVEGKVIKRYDIDGIKTIDISSITVSPKEEVWAASDKTGKVYIIDPKEQTNTHAFQAVDENIVDMIFSQDGKSIFTIGWSSVISIWFIKE